LNIEQETGKYCQKTDLLLAKTCKKEIRKSLAYTLTAQVPELPPEIPNGVSFILFSQKLFQRWFFNKSQMLRLSSNL